MKQLIAILIAATALFGQPQSHLNRGGAIPARGLVASYDFHRTNLLKWSEDFEKSPWTPEFASVLANSGIAPDGSNTADKLVEATGTSIHDVYQIPNLSAGTFTVSWYAKPAGRSFTSVYISDLNSDQFFDIASGAIGSTPAGSKPSIIAVGNGWYRCIVTFTSAGGNVIIGLRSVPSDGGVITYAGDGSSGIYIWGAQLNPGPTALPYSRTTDLQSVTNKATYGEAENLLKWSEDFSNAVWGDAGSATHTVNTVTFSAFGFSELVQTPATTVGTTYTFSFEAMSSSGATVRGKIWTGGGGSVVLTSDVPLVANQWTRVAISGTVVGGNANFAIMNASDGVSRTINIRNAQLNTGSVAKPYVKTTSAAVSRTAYTGRRGNLIQYSEDFTNGAWVQFGTATKTGQKVTFAASEDSGVYQDFSFAPGTTYSLTASVRSATAKKFRLCAFQPPNICSSDFTTTAASQVFSYTFTTRTSFISPNFAVRNESGGGVGEITVDWVQLNRVTNLLKWTEDFRNIIWTWASSPTVALDQIAPDGSASAIRITPSALSQYSGVEQASTAKVTGAATVSIWARAVTGSTTFRFNAAEAGIADHFSPDITVGTEWQRVSFTYGSYTGSGVVFLAVNNASDGVPRAVELWHPQLNVGSTALPYERVDASPVLPYERTPYPDVTLGASSAAGTDDPAVAVGDVYRRNILLNTSTWSTFVAADVVATTGQADASGGTTAVRLVFSGGVGDSAQYYSSQAFVVGATYTCSMNAKVASGSGAIRLRIGTAGPGSDVALTTSWVRVSSTAVAVAASSYVVIYNGTSDAAQTVYLDSPQCELGTVASPYQQIGPRNLLTWTEDHTHAGWNANSAPTLTPSQPDPISGSAATRFVTSALYSGVWQATSLGTAQITQSVWLKGAVGGELVWIGKDTDLKQLTLTTAWQRYSHTFTAGVGVVIYAATASPQTFYVWGSQAELGSTPTNYEKIGAAWSWPVQGSAGLKFDGVNDLATPGNIANVTSAFSLIAVARPAAGTNQCLICKDGAGAASTVAYDLVINSADHLQLYVSDGVMKPSLATVASVTPAWHFFAGVFNSGSVSLYVDAAKESGSVAVTSANVVAYPVNIGAVTSGVFEFNGTIAAVLIYDRALSDGEIQQAYRALKKQWEARGVYIQ